MTAHLAALALCAAALIWGVWVLTNAAVCALARCDATYLETTESP